jgi:ASPIC and UnbV/FG-GAP-like repeat
LRKTAPLAAALALGAAAAVAAVLVGTRGDSVEIAAGAPRLGTAGAALAFREVAAERGLRFRHSAFRHGVSSDPAAMVGGGLCWLDYDGDGRLDLFVVDTWSQDERDEWLDAGGLPTSRLFRNVGGRFADVTDETGAGLAIRGQGCVAADLDADGHTDLYVTSAERSALLWNRGDGTFEEGAEAAGVDAFGWYAGAAAGDLNGDGLPELIVTGYADLNKRLPSATVGFPGTHGGVRDLLFVNEGDRRFREAGAEAGLEVVRFEHGLGVVLSDLDRDGDLDAYVANDGDPNRLYANVAWPGGAAADPAGLGFRFEERAAAAAVADPGSGMGVAAGDYDGDGRVDLFVTNARRQTHAVFRGGPDDVFADVRAELGATFSGSTGWGVSWADLDLDSDLDLALVNGNVPVTDLRADAERLQLFRNGGRGRFEALRLRPVGPLLARGSAAADYDNDGDVDLAVASVGGPLALLENTGTAGTWLEVALDAFAPGAEVTVVLPDGRRLRRQAQAGGSYLSSEDPRLHFGLGGARRVRELVVRWPDGEETRVADVAANRLVVVERPS